MWRQILIVPNIDVPTKLQGHFHQRLIVGYLFSMLQHFISLFDPENTRGIRRLCARTGRVGCVKPEGSKGAIISSRSTPKPSRSDFVDHHYVYDSFALHLNAKYLHFIIAIFLTKDTPASTISLLFWAQIFF